jgi:hypothetical protein
VPDIVEYAWNQIEKKIDKNESGCIHFATTFEFEYGYGYPYLRFTGYGYQMIPILFPHFHSYCIGDAVGGAGCARSMAGRPRDAITGCRSTGSIKRNISTFTNACKRADACAQSY